MSDQGGFTPIAPGPSLEDEERAMKSGRGRMIAGMVVAIAAAVGGFAFYLSEGGESEYAVIGRSINGIDGEKFDQFWACALPRAELDEIRNNDQLRDAIVQRARTAPRRYAQHVRETCLVRLDEAVPAIDQLLAPDDLREHIDGMRVALVALRAAWDAFLAHLDQLGTEPFDAEAASDVPLPIARGWYDYKVAYGRVNTIVREHLER